MKETARRSICTSFAPNSINSCASTSSRPLNVFASVKNSLVSSFTLQRYKKNMICAKKCAKICVYKKKAVPLHAFSLNSIIIWGPENFNFWGERSSKARKDGRVVYCVGLENRSTETYRGFESLSFRKVNNICPRKGSACYLSKREGLLVPTVGSSYLAQGARTIIA